MFECVVIGVNGQDGIYLSRFLSKRGLKVIGVGRQSRQHTLLSGYLQSYIQQDLTDELSYDLCNVVMSADHIFYCAALHGNKSFRSNIPKSASKRVNLLLPLQICEKLKGKFTYFSTRLIFGEELKGTVSEKTGYNPGCLYSEQKAQFSFFYRNLPDTDKKKINIPIFFNHESRLRKSEFLYNKILHSLMTDQNPIKFTDTLNFFNDWGSAEDFMYHLSNNFEVHFGETIWATGIMQYTSHAVRNAIGKNIESNSCPELEYTVDTTRLKTFIPNFNSRILSTLLKGDINCSK